MTGRGPICQHDTPSLRGALATKQSMLSFRGEMDCFARLAMTGRELTPPLAAVRLRRSRWWRVISLRCLLVIARTSCVEAIHTFFFTTAFVFLHPPDHGRG